MSCAWAALATSCTSYQPPQLHVEQHRDKGSQGSLISGGNSSAAGTLRRQTSSWQGRSPAPQHAGSSGWATVPALWWAWGRLSPERSWGRRRWVELLGQGAGRLLCLAGRCVQSCSCGCKGTGEGRPSALHGQPRGGGSVRVGKDFLKTGWRSTAAVGHSPQAPLCCDAGPRLQG